MRHYEAVAVAALHHHHAPFSNVEERAIQLILEAEASAEEILGDLGCPGSLGFLTVDHYVFVRAVAAVDKAALQTSKCSADLKGSEEDQQTSLECFEDPQNFRLCA